MVLKRLEGDGLLRYQRKEVTTWLDRRLITYAPTPIASQVETPSHIQ